MADSHSSALEPVFLEPRDDYWEIHRPANLDIDRQRRYQLAPRGTAEQLSNAVYCEDCFPRRASADRE